MTNEVKIAITNAVYEVYKSTTNPYQNIVCDRTVSFTVPTNLGDFNKSIRISRGMEKEEIFYKLYVHDDKNPFMLVFGCWPIGFVADIFIKTLEHYYD